MKKVVMISYWFPPNNFVASLRAGQLAKYLPDFGWEPHVITADWGQGTCAYDPAMVELPDAVHVYRCDHRKLGSDGTRLLWPVKEIGRLAGLNLFPSLWVKSAIACAERVFETEAPDVLWSTAPTMDAFFVAYHLHRKYRIPWVADMRDTSDNTIVYHRRLVRAILAREEALFCNAADLVSVVSKGQADALSRRVKGEIAVMPNGYDPSLYEEPATPERFSKFSFLYIGQVFQHQDPALLLEALKNLVEAGRIDRKDLSLTFLGTDAGYLSGIVPPCLKDCVEILGRVPLRECVRYQMRACILLLIAFPDQPGIVTGKVFEYLAAGRPILSVPKDNNGIDELLEETGAGVSCNADLLPDRILSWYEEWKRTGTVGYGGDKDAIGLYSRRNQARLLSEMFGLCQERKTG